MTVSGSFPRHRAAGEVRGGGPLVNVRVDSVQRHTAYLHRTRLQGNLQHLLEQACQGIQVSLAKIEDGAEIWLIACREHPKGDVFLQPALNRMAAQIGTRKLTWSL